MAEVQTENPLKALLKAGQSVWYDGLVPAVEFERMIREDGLKGATTNPAIFEKALGDHAYDARIGRMAGTHDAEQIYRVLAVEAVQGVADVFLPVFSESAGRDGFVSMEVSPFLAADTASTVREARELWRAVNRKNVMIKVPATPEGIPAIRTLIAEGINVNITLIFSIERYRRVMEAYLSGLEERLSLSEPLGGIASVASFFVSRVDTAVDKMLEAGSAPRSLFGRAAVANSKTAYRSFEEIFQSPRFEKLKGEGARVQRPLWASTGTKNPDYSDVLYVEPLIGPDTVNTMPPATIKAFRDHGRVSALSVRQGLEEARQTLGELESHGVDMGRVTRDLEEQGVRLFCDAYQKIIDGIKAKKNG